MNITTYIFIRSLSILAQIAGAVAIVFAMLQVIPYDPVVFFLFFYSGDPAQREILADQLRSQLGIDVPIYVQYFRFIRNLVVDGSIGTSWTSGLPVSDMIASSIQYTIISFGIAFIIYTIIAIILGVYAATRRGKLIDILSRLFTSATYAIPSYVLGLWLVIWGLDYGLAPFPTINPSIFSTLKYSILPIVTVVLIYSGFQFRLVRRHMLEILSKDYIRTARAKGLPERVVIYKHAMLNAIPFFITTIAVTFPISFSGVAALEVVFGIPGIGKLMVTAANNFDWPVLIGTTVVFTVANAIILGITDILVYYFSPKLRVGQGISRFY